MKTISRCGSYVNEDSEQIRQLCGLYYMSWISVILGNNLSDLNSNGVLLLEPYIQAHNNNNDNTFDLKVPFKSLKVIKQEIQR